MVKHTLKTEVINNQDKGNERYRKTLFDLINYILEDMVIYNHSSKVERTFEEKEVNQKKILSRLVNLRSSENMIVCRTDDTDELVGFVTCGQTSQEWYIYTIYVIPAVMRNGIGAQLMGLAEKMGNSKGCKYSIVLEDNAEPEEFFSKCGYIKTPMPAPYEDVVWLKKLNGYIEGFFN